MHSVNRRAKINIKLVVVLILVAVALGISLIAARQVRIEIISETSLREGQDAFDREDWPEACKKFKDYLVRNPDDVEILKKYAKARLSVRPLNAETLQHAISAYRLVIQQDPLDADAYEKLALLYTSIANFDELVHIARTRLMHDPQDLQAPLWLAKGLARLKKMKEARQVMQEFIDRLEPLPDKPIQYVRACIGMSEALMADNPDTGRKTALEYLNKAANQAPKSAEARLARARFYTRTPEIPGITNEQQLALARKDLEAADDLEAEHPHTILLLGSEWIARGELEKAQAQLTEAQNLPPATIQEHFLDVNDWVVAGYNLALELAAKKADVARGTAIVDEALKKLKEPRHRVQILPSAVTLLVDANDITGARSCLTEYMDQMQVRDDSTAATLRLVYLQALVAKAERRPYEVINILQPVIVNEKSRPQLWGLLADAYNQTGQTRREIGALTQYLRLRPENLQMTRQLANTYFKLSQWDKVLELAKKLESLDASDITARLLRIEAAVHLATKQPGGSDKPRLEELSDELAKLSRQYPDQREIMAMQAGIAERLGNTAEAEKILRAALENNEQSFSTEMRLIKHYQRLGRNAQAIDECKAACKRHPQSADCLLLLAELYLADADYNSARDCLKKGLDTVTAESEKRSVSMRLALLELTQSDQADRDAGINRLRQLAEQDKGDIQARNLLLAAREIRQDAAETEKLINELKQIEGDSGLMWRMHEASMWFESDQWRSRQQDITNHLQHCIASDPGSTAPVLLLANLYGRLDNLSRAEDVYRQALARDRSNTVIANRLLLILEKQGRFSEAEQVLRDLQRSGADSGLAGDWAVRIAVHTGDLSQAVEQLKLRISNNDRDADSRIQLAHLIYGQQRDPNLAFQYLDQAEEITPDSMAIKAARVSILTAEARTEEARQILDNAVKKTESFPAYMMRAEYLSNQGEFELAEKDYKKLTTFTTNSIAGYGLLSDFYARNERLDRAMETLEQALNQHPDDPRLTRRLMQFLFARDDEQDTKKAFEILARLEEDSPNDPALMKLRATQLLKHPTPQSVRTVRQLLENVIKFAPTDVEAHLTLIDIAIQSTEYKLAGDLATRALGLNPDNLALLSVKSRIELRLENPRMAAELANLALQRDPDNAEAQDLLVRAALNSKDTDLLKDVRSSLDSAIANDPNDEKLLISRAHVFTAMQQPDAAIPELEAYCRKNDPNQSVSVMITLADLYRLNGDMDAANNMIQQARRIDPNSQAIVHARLLCLIQQNRTAELADISSAYIAADAQNPNMLMAAASILSASDSNELRNEGLRLYKHGVDTFPILVPVRLGLASALYGLRQIEPAKLAYRQVLEQSPNNIQALNDLAWILHGTDGNSAKALELADKGLSIVPNDPHLLDTRGTILASIDDRLADAKRDFQRLLELSDPNTPQRAKTHLQLGRVCAKLDDNNEARMHIEKALDIHKAINVFTPEEVSEMMKIAEKSGK